MGIGIVILISILAGVIAVCVYLGTCLGKVQENSKDKDKRWREELNCRELENSKAAAKIEDLEKKLKELEIAKGKEEVQTYRLDDINSSISNKNEELSQLREQWAELNESVGKLNEGRNQQQEVVRELGVQKEELETLLNQLRLQVQGSKNELSSVGSELSRLLEMKKVTEKEENDVWGTPELDGREEKLLGLIRDIEDLYPDLRVDLAGIEGKRIGLPKLQDNCRDLDGVKGIYRLVLKEDESIGYVGQAVNIKERGYQHVKKMIGAVPKGNESLYRYNRPDLFYWTVVQSNKDIDLNQSEKYWIEYFGMGLNRKL